MALTAKQKMFVSEYLVDLNATRAAKAAGYSAKTADVIGYENLGKPYIAEAIQREMDKRAKKVDITAENVLQDILDTRARVAEVMATVDDRDIATLANARAKQNEMLGKHLQLFTEKIEHSGEQTVTIVNSLPRCD